MEFSSTLPLNAILIRNINEGLSEIFLRRICCNVVIIGPVQRLSRTEGQGAEDFLLMADEPLPFAHGHGDDRPSDTTLD